LHEAAGILTRLIVFRPERGPWAVPGRAEEASSAQEFGRIAGENIVTGRTESSQRRWK
jgi:hypothetical protein